MNHAMKQGKELTEPAASQQRRLADLKQKL